VLAVRTSRRVDDISNTGAGCVSVTFCDLDLQFQSLLAIDLMMMSDVLLCSGNEKARTCRAGERPFQEFRGDMIYT
jgi:hypothetical protein